MECLDPRARALPPGVDWEALTEQAVRFGLAPLLHHRSSSADPPSAVRDRLRDAYSQEVGLAFFRLRELGQIVDVLQARGIRCLVFKGLAVAQEAYGDPALRTMGDLDILVPRERLEEADAALLELGYAVEPTLNRARLLEQHYHFAYRKPGALAELELHWHLHRPVTPFEIPLDDLWSRARQVELAGRRVLVMDPTDHFLYLCLHISKHRFRSGPRPFCDLIHLLQAAPPEWDQLLQRAQQWKASRYLALTLAVVSRLYPESLPSGVLGKLRSPPEAITESALRLVLEPDLKASEEELKVAGYRRFFSLGTQSRAIRRRYPGWPLPLAYVCHFLSRLVSLAWGKLRRRLDAGYRHRLEESVTLESWLSRA